MVEKLSKSDDLILTANFEFEFESYYKEDLTEFNEEFSYSKDLCQSFCMLEHVFYNVIYDERYDLKTKNFYTNDKKSPCLIKLEQLFYTENVKKKMIEYAIKSAYGMVKSDLEKEEMHKQLVKEWKKELKRIDKKIYNTLRFGNNTANKIYRLKRYRKRKSIIQKKIDAPYSSKRTFGSKSIRQRIDSIYQRVINEKIAKATKSHFAEEKKKNKHITWDEVKQKYFNVTLTQEEIAEVAAEKERLKEEFKNKRYGKFCSLGYAAEWGNRFFRLVKDEDDDCDTDDKKKEKKNNIYVLFCPDKKRHIKLRITNTNGYDDLLETMYNMANICQVPLTYTLDLYKRELHISYNPIILYGREKWEQIKSISHRVYSMDLNPDESGGVAVEFYGKHGFKILWAEVYSIKEINDEDRKLDGLNLKSSDKRRLHIKNKRHYEIDIICKDIIKVARHFQCEMFALEKLNFSPYNPGRGKDFNKLVNKYWCRNRFYQNIQRECKRYNIEFKEIVAAYSSFVGNFLFRGTELPDMCLAALEIARRAYRLKEVYKNKKDIPEDKKEQIVLLDAEDFRQFVVESLKEFHGTLLKKKCDFYEELNIDSKHFLKNIYNAIGTKMVRVRLDSLLKEDDERVHRSHTLKSKTKRIIFKAKDIYACVKCQTNETVTTGLL